MIKNTKIFICLVLFMLICCLIGCNKERELECNDYNSFVQLKEENEDCLIFVHKSDCKYCEKAYAYVNEYYYNSSKVIVAYNFDYGKIEEVDVSRFPTLIKMNKGNMEIVAIGFNQVKLYLLDNGG